MRVPNIHFDPESRQLQTARLEHLLSFSDLLLLLIAEPGLGRTHLLTRLRPEQNPVQPYWVQITPDSAFDVTQLLQSLVAQLGLSCEPTNRSRLTALHGYARALEQVEQQLVICVDDADYLSDNALELLINFSKVDSAAPKVLLAGLPEFEQRFYEREFNRLVEGTLHVEHLQPYTAEEARAFVDAHMIDGGVLKDSEYRRLLHESQGRPDQLKSALARMLDQRAGASKAVSGVGNRWYWAGIGLVLSSVALALGYLYYPEAAPEENIRRPVEIAVPQVTPATQTQEPQLIEARSDLAKRLAEQEARLAEVSEVGVVPAVESTAVAPAEPAVAESESTPRETESPAPLAEIGLAPEPDEASVPETTPLEVAEQRVLQLPPGADIETPEVLVNPPIEIAQSDIAVETQTSVKPQKGARSSAAAQTPTDSAFSAAIDQVLAWPASHLTVQLLAAREERTADQLLAKHANIDGLLKLTYPYQGAPRYTVVYNHFSTRTDAQNAVNQLPATLQRLKPWIRSVAGLKSELNEGLNP